VSRALATTAVKAASVAVDGGVAVERVVGYKDESILRTLAERAQRLRRRQ